MELIRRYHWTEKQIHEEFTLDTLQRLALVDKLVHKKELIEQKSAEARMKHA